LAGAKVAKGQVLTFFDSHIECTEGELQLKLSFLSDHLIVPASCAHVETTLYFSSIPVISLKDQQKN